MLEAGMLIKELQQMRDEGHLSDALLRKAVRSVSQDERFEWVGVYLLRDDELWLHNYVGEPTEHAKIPVGTGVCGRAVAERTELVILIRAGDDIFGQIDIDSESKAAFTEEDEITLIGVADKLAEQIAAERREAS